VMWKHIVLKVGGLLDKYFYSTFTHRDKQITEWKKNNKEMVPQYQDWFVCTINQPWWNVLCS